ncbi:MAG: glycosyltransferase family 39 protein [Oscillospiraceae bacterium]|nr:glycosyltransferase family 39 protein [Oscillospiraceae bacterium]
MKLFKEKKILYYAAVFVIVALAYVMWRLMSPDAEKFKVIMGIVIAAEAGFDLILLKQKKLTTDTLVKSIMFAGLIMRIGYMLYTPASVRSHDMWEFEKDGYGHAGYILTLIEDKMLPQTNIRQYYQQPFFYILCALVSAPINGFLGGSGGHDPEMIVDTGKIISGAASCIVLLMTDSFCKELDLKGKYRAAAVGFVAFCPAFFLSERITPDMLCTLLMTIALIYTIRWYRSPDWKNTIILAFTYGLGVMTKLSIGSLAIFTAGVFAWKFFESVKEKKFGPYIPKFIVFGIISLPLGLWYSVRNYRRFDQPFGYVLEIPKDHSLYTGDHSFFQRVVLPDLPNFITEPYAEVFEDYNLWTYMVKSSLFGEFKFEVPVIFPIGLMFAAIALTIPSVTGVVKGAFRMKENKDQFLMSAAVLVFMASIVYFYIKYPNGCSMDFRYMTFIVAPAAVLAGKYCAENGKKWIGTLYLAAVPVYALFSTLMYTMIK